MGRRKKPSIVENSDSLFDCILDKAKAYFGSGNIYTGSEAECKIVGLKLPALCLRYLFQSNIFPLGRATMLAGKQGSCKSSLLYEIFRWHRLYKGRNFLFETETKDSPDLRNSILNYDQKAVALKPSFTTEGWMKDTIWFLDECKKMMEGTPSKPGPGKIAPVAMGVDSLTATISEKTTEDIRKADGAPSARFANEAKLIADFLRNTTPQLADWPISFLGTNHLKPSMDQMGRPVKNIPGGIALLFHCTYVVEMAFVKDIRKANVNGIEVDLKLLKNSLGQSRNSIRASMIWWNDYTEEGIPIQQTEWDWDTATMEMLVSMKDSHAPVWKKIEEYLDLHASSAGGKRVWSNALGIPSTDALPYKQAARVLEENKEIITIVENYLGIKRRTEFIPGFDYDQQIKDALTELIEPSTEDYLEEILSNDEPTP